MPGQQIAQANPPPDASLLPDSLLDFGVQLDNKDVLSKDELSAIHKFRRAADYIAAGTHSTGPRSMVLNIYAFKP
jgi:xylulose-5-phosphate/fructose-6-phosphate phosphoketolase